jgi:hypothetical protein
MVSRDFFSKLKKMAGQIASLKYNYSEKATQILPIVHFLFDIKHLAASNCKLKMVQSFVASSEYLNFKDTVPDDNS